MNNPFIPLGKADTVVVAGNIDNESYEKLKNMNLRVIKTIGHEKVDNAIRFHPDLVMHPIDHNSLVIEPSVFDYYKECFSKTKIKIIRGERKLSQKYPLDISYNVGRIENLVIHKLKYTDEVLKYHLKKRNLEFVNIKQGYTKCSMAIVGKREVITSDRIIDKTLQSFGINSLLISPGFIDLEGHDYGFIGGCTGNLSDEEVLISGNLKKHPDLLKIEEFLNRFNKKTSYLSKKKINDIGSIIALNCD